MRIRIHSAHNQHVGDNNVITRLIFDRNMKDPHADRKYGAKDSIDVTHIAHKQHVLTFTQQFN